MTRATTDAIRKLETGTQLSQDELPRLISEIGSEFADLVRLSATVVAALLRTRGIFVSSRALGTNKTKVAGDDTRREERLVLRVSEAASMLGVSRSSVYEMINKGQIGVVRFGTMMRIPRSEIDRFLTDNLTMPVR